MVFEVQPAENISGSYSPAWVLSDTRPPRGRLRPAQPVVTNSAEKTVWLISMISLCQAGAPGCGGLVPPGTPTGL